MKSGYPSQFPSEEESEGEFKKTITEKILSNKFSMFVVFNWISVDKKIERFLISRK